MGTRIMLRKGLCVLIAVAVVITFSLHCNFAKAEEKNPNKYETMESFKAALNRLDKSDKLTSQAVDSIISKTDEEVVNQFLIEKHKLAKKELTKIDIDSVMEPTSDGNYAGSKVIDLGDGYKVLVEFADKEEPTFFRNLRDLIFEPVYAAENGEVLWKDFGNRYFTAKSTSLLGAGFCTMRLEVHYKLSANGIDYRYGVGDVAAASFTGDIHADDPVATDKVARTPGASDINVYCKYLISGHGGGNYRINATVKYMAKRSNQIKVKHSWNLQ